MTLTAEKLDLLTTRKAGAHMVSRLPGLCAKKNAALIASLKKGKEAGK